MIQLNNIIIKNSNQLIYEDYKFGIKVLTVIQKKNLPTNIINNSQNKSL